MAMQSIQLKAEPRSALGSRANKRLRDSGFIPGVVYGHKEAVIPVTLPKKELSTPWPTAPTVRPQSRRQSEKVS